METKTSLQTWMKMSQSLCPTYEKDAISFGLKCSWEKDNQNTMTLKNP